MNLLLKQCRLISPDQETENASILIENGVVKRIFAEGDALPSADRVMDVKGAMTMPGFIDRRIRYNAMSMISRVIPEDIPNTQSYLQLPADLSPRVISLAAGLAAGGGKEGTLRNIYNHLHSSRYRYSLTGLPVTKNPLDYFLFESRSGNC